MSAALLAIIAFAAGEAANSTAPSPASPSPGASYLDDLVARARSQDLAHDRAWLRLGRWRPRLLGGHESEVDAPEFFLAPGGKRDPAAELEATLRGLFSEAPSSPAPQPDETAQAARAAAIADHPQCRFPARFAFLASRLALDPEELPRRDCPRLADFVQRVGARSAALVFSSYYLNDPASAFGHTFLRLGRAPPGAAADALELVDVGVDYAATVTALNPLLYALYGLTGRFHGEFTARPYFYKVREYADFESRDLWEYELDLSPAELGMLVLHLWELGQAWLDYWYLDENCSYHVLGALEAAAPRLDLLSRLGWIVLPAEAVRAVAASPGLVRAVRFRPSSRTQLEARAARLSREERALVVDVADGRAAPALEAQPPLDRARVLDTALDLYDVRHAREVVRGEPAAVEARQRLLERRAALGVASPPLEVSPPARGGPDRGHASGRLAVGGGASSADGPLVVLQARTALHDLLDPPAGFAPGMQLEFLKGRLSYATRERSLRLDDATLVEATVLNGLGGFEPRPTWRFAAGAGRVTDAGCAGCVAGKLTVGGGPAWLAPGGGSAVALTADAELLMAPALSGAGGSGFRPGVGPSALARLLAGERAALLGTASWRWLPAAAPQTTFALGVEGRLHLGAVSLGAALRRTPVATEGELTLGVYGR
jgi:hypothetical protein